MTQHVSFSNNNFYVKSVSILLVFRFNFIDLSGYHDNNIFHDNNSDNDSDSDNNNDNDKSTLS